MTTTTALPTVRLGARYTALDVIDALAIPNEHVSELTQAFDVYRLKRFMPATMPSIREYLSDPDEKPKYKRSLAGSVLGQSGCFPYATRTSVLAWHVGIRSTFAHSTGKRILHVLLLDEAGVPFQPRELERGGIVPMRIWHIWAYAHFVQPLLIAGHWLRRAHRKK